MLLFSPKAQQVIDEAMTLLDAPQRQLWLSWLAGRSELPGDDGSRAPLPADVAGAILAALTAQKVQLRRLLDAADLSDDEISDLDNDLTHIGAVERSVYDNVERNHVAA